MSAAYLIWGDKQMSHNVKELICRAMKNCCWFAPKKWWSNNILWLVYCSILVLCSDWKRKVNEAKRFRQIGANSCRKRKALSEDHRCLSHTDCILLKYRDAVQALNCKARNLRPSVCSHYIVSISSILGTELTPSTCDLLEAKKEFVTIQICDTLGPE